MRLCRVVVLKLEVLGQSGRVFSARELVAVRDRAWLCPDRADG